METITDIKRASALDAVDILNDLIGDFVAGTRVLADHRDDYRASRISKEQMSVVQKMCISHLVLSFAKLLEFWKRYRQLVPAKHLDKLNALNADLRNKGVERFRSTVAGHI